MGREIMVFGIIWAINFLIVIIYLIWNVLLKKKEHKRSYWIRSIVMLLCPVVGCIFFLLAHVLYLLFFSESVDLEDVVFSKERVRTIVRADEESERNMVPLEEAIEVTDTDGLRTLMMNVVRGDIRKSLTSISLALNSEDSETAHYAASVLQDALNDFRVMVDRQYQQIKAEEEHRAINAAILIDYMYHVLAQKVFTEMEQVAYVKLMEEVCEILYKEDLERMTSTQFERVCLLLMDIDDYGGCEKWCRRATYLYPNTLSTYTCQLKMYFNSGQKDKFFEVIEELKKSAIVVDSETLELIRVFR